MDYDVARKKIIIKPGFQLRTALVLVLYILAYSLILGAIIFYPLYHELNTATSLDAQANVSKTILYLHRRIWPGLLAVAVLAGIQSVLASRRIAGPMYRFEKMATDLIRGNYKARIRTRKGDEFKDMTRLLNDLASDLEVTKARHVQFCTDVKARLETLSAMLEGEGTEYRDKVKGAIEGIVSELDYHTKVG